MKHLLPLLLLFKFFFILNAANAQNINWAKQGVGGASDNVYAMAFDKEGNSYIVGHNSSSWTYGNINQLEGGMLIKYNPDGEVIWGKAFSGVNYYGNVNRISTDNENNVYVVGYFSGQLALTERTITSRGSYATQTQHYCESPTAAVTMHIQPYQISFATSGDTLIAPAAESYQWYFNDKEIKGAVNRKFLVRNTGNYKAKTITHGCLATSNNGYHVISLAAATLTLSPNPTPQQLLYTFSSNVTGSVEVVVWNDLGQRVYRQTRNKPTTQLHDILMVNNLRPGMYLLEVKCGKERLVRKFIKI